MGYLLMVKAKSGTAPKEPAAFDAYHPWPPCAGIHHPYQTDVTHLEAHSKC